MKISIRIEWTTIEGLDTINDSRRDDARVDYRAAWNEQMKEGI